MTLPLWKLWFADESTFSNLDGDWEEAPCDGVQFLMVSDEIVPPREGPFAQKNMVSRHGAHMTPENRTLYGEDFYANVEGSFPCAVTPDAVLELYRDYCMRKFGMAREVLEKVQHVNLTLSDYVAVGVKRGRMIPTKDYNRIVQLAVHDPEFP